jgi:hypothetical protein
VGNLEGVGLGSCSWFVVVIADAMDVLVLMMLLVVVLPM